MAGGYKRLILRNYVRYRHLVLYGIIGCGCVAVDFVVFGILTYFFPEYYIIANVASVHCGIICSFLLNRHFNFKIKNKTIIRFFIFYTVGLLGLLISSGLLYLMIDVWGMHVLFVKLVTIMIVTLFQFILNKNVTFRQNG